MKITEIIRAILAIPDGGKIVIASKGKINNKLNVLQVQGVLKYLLQTQRHKDREIKKLKEQIKDLQSYKEFLVDGNDNASPNSKNDQQDSQYRQFQKVSKEIDRISDSMLDKSEEFITTKPGKSPPAENKGKSSLASGMSTPTGKAQLQKVSEEIDSISESMLNKSDEFLTTKPGKKLPTEDRGQSSPASGMSTPFGKAQVVKPGNYINVPVKYCPSSNINHMTTMEVIGEDKDSVILKTTQTYKNGKQDSQQHRLQKVDKSGELPAMTNPGKQCSVGFQSSGVGTGFVTMHEKLVVQSGNYINVPIKYCPVSNSKHMATMEVIGEDPESLILKTTMKGRCI